MKRLICLLSACVLLFTGCFGGQAEETPPVSKTETAKAETIEQPPVPAAETEPALEVELPFTACAYLPVNALPADLDAFLADYDAIIDRFDYLILNTGVYWNAAGELDLAGQLPAVLERLQGRVGLWCTINPKGELIRAGTAGDTIDTPEKRAALARTLADFAAEYQLAGIDIDWEFPQEDEWDDLSALIVTLKETLSISREINSQKIIAQEIVSTENPFPQLSLSLYPRENPLTKDAVAALDYLNIMAYDQFDQQGFHSTMQTAEDAVDHFLAQGFAPRQLVLGIPAYGRPLDGSARWELYRDIDFAAVSPDNPNLVGDIYFNSAALMEEKTSYARKQHLAGVMLYHLLCL